MDIDNIDKNAELFATEYFKIVKAQNRLLIIDQSLELLSKDLEKHRLKMKKEHQDVARLEKMSKNYLFYQVLGNKTERLKRERQEYLQAVLEYNSIAREMELLEYEKRILKQLVEQKHIILHKRDYYLKLKEQRLLFNKSEVSSAIRKVNDDIGRIKKFIKELHEAKEVSIVLKKKIRSAFTKLMKVERFGKREYYGRGKNNAFAKKAYLDKAIMEAVEINLLINKLDKELSDIYSKYVFFSIYKYQNFIDTFYDHLITDWVLQNKLKNAINCLTTAEDQIKKILATLNNDIHRSQSSLEQKVEEKRDFVLKAEK